MRISLALVLFAFALPLDATAVAGGRLEKPAACALLKKKVAHLNSLPQTGPPGMGWYCDFTNLSGNRWFVVALRAHRACEGNCSNLMGWYAISRRNGEIHAYDVAKLKVGLAL